MVSGRTWQNLEGPIGMDGEEEVAVAAEADFLQSSTVVDSGGKKLWPLHHVVKTVQPCKRQFCLG